MINVRQEFEKIFFFEIFMEQYYFSEESGMTCTCGV